uniref:hypothetical protein n=1 Tax=Aureimonas sp. AU4 TaxID=1638163 RepID=UPI000B0C72A2
PAVPPVEAPAAADLPDGEVLGAGTAFTAAAALPDNPVRLPVAPAETEQHRPGTAALEATTALHGTEPDGDPAHLGETAATLSAPSGGEGMEAILPEPRFADAEREAENRTGT